ncbi:MAG: MFS transporter, partial [Chloroflexota bacterium]
PPKQLDRLRAVRARRRTAAAAIGALVALGLPTGMLGVAWPSIRDALGAPLAGLGVLLTAMTIAQFGASTFSGAIRDRIGTTLVLLLPALLAAIGLALFAVATDWIVITLAAAVLGAGVGLLDAAVNTEAALRRGVRFMAALHAAWAAGASLGPVIITFAIVGIGSWRAGFAVSGIAFVVVASAIYLLRTDLEQAPQHPTAPATSGISLLLSGIALMFVYVGVELGAGQWAYTRFTAAAELETTTAATAVFFYWAALGAGRIVLAIVGDRLSARRWLDLSVGGAVIATLAFTVLPVDLAALVALPCLGASLSVFVPVLIYLTPQRVGHDAAPRAIGYMVAAGMLGGATIPATIGVVMQTAGVATLGPALALLALILAAIHVAASRRS